MCMVQRCKSPCFPSSLSTGAAETKEDFCPVKSHEVVVMLSCHLNLCILHPFSLYWLVFVLWLCCCRYAMSCDPTHGGKCSRLANFNCRGTQCALGCGWFYLSWHGVMMRQGMGVGWGVGGNEVKEQVMITRTKDKHETEFEQLNLTMKHTNDCAQVG